MGSDRHTNTSCEDAVLPPAAGPTGRFPLFMLVLVPIYFYFFGRLQLCLQEDKNNRM